MHQRSESAFDSWSSPERSRSRALSLRKRHSFFGRSNTSGSVDVSENRSLPTLHEWTGSSQSAQTPEFLPPRSSTAMSDHQRQQIDMEEPQRRSLFGSRKRSSSKTSTRASSFNIGNDGGEQPASRTSFASEHEYYRHQKKTSISPPFNFQHITHTKKKHLPALETVNEQELSKEFWAASAYQPPRRRLHGIPTEDLDDKLGALGVPRGATSSRPATPTSPESARSPPSMMSPNRQREGFASQETTYQPLPPVRPHRHSFGVPSWQMLDQAEAEEANADNDLDSTFLHDETPSPGIGVALDSSPETINGLERTHSQQVRERARQPLPALPPLEPLNRSSQTSRIGRRSANMSTTSLVQTSTASTVNSSPKSRHSSRSIPQSSIAPSLWSMSDSTNTHHYSDASWEDVVDFCYEQEAEATCDFDWSKMNAEQLCNVESDVAPTTRAERRLSTMFVPQMGDNPPVAVQRRRHSPSVGHRGFLEARKHSMILLGATDDSQNAPLLNVIPAEDGVARPMISSAVAQFTKLDMPGVGGYLSDPESHGGSQHRKSSSYGSYESIIKQSRSSQELGRGSLGSNSSVPELLHSRRNTNVLSSFETDRVAQKSLLPPLASLEEPGSIVHRTSAARRRAAQSSPDMTIMRRPETAGDRAILQAAGRAVKAGRQSTPIRFSQLLREQSPPPPPAQGVDYEGPAWI